MAEPLKNQFGPEVPRKIAKMLQQVWREFPSKDFLAQCLKGYEPLNLMQRAWQIADALHDSLPPRFNEASEYLLDSLGPKIDETDNLGMSSFLYLPHGFYVAKYGLNHFDVSMKAQYELTQRFTSEFSIRPFLEKYPEKTLKRLKIWAEDPSPHVRRLVSEGTRPRLPWASRLRQFQKDPKPVISLLELLKDDPELYVRRSVANNLNDIGKDHPALLISTAEKWMKGGTAERQWIVRHALRSSVKRGDREALRVLGFSGHSNVSVENVNISPKAPTIGGTLQISFELRNRGKKIERILVDFRIHFIKARGKIGPKVFKLRAVELEPSTVVCLRKKVSLKEMTTRKHYSGTHQVDAILNGQSQWIGEFKLRPEK